ncbi:MAG: dihydropteroate synthase [Alphaproteobacteria bacterium]
MPTGIVAGKAAALTVEAGYGRPLAGGALAFTGCEVLRRTSPGFSVTALPLAGLGAWAESQGRGVAGSIAWQMTRLTEPCPPWAGLTMDRPRLMGVVNVTPDSFSDGGTTLNPSDAIARGLALLAAGADLIDVGGESTRPGAQPVSPGEEIARIEPVVRALSERGALVSIDTRHAAVMAAAVAAGARILNDVTALAGDAGSMAVAADCSAAVLLMHMQGEPRTMQAAPEYQAAPLDVLDFLAQRVEACQQAGIAPDRIAVDPGIGFGKTVAHNVEILNRLALLHLLGRPVVLGASRKSFIAHLDRDNAPPPDQRLPGSLAAVLAGLGQGVRIFRVHDVAETHQAITVWRAIAGEAL